MCKRMCLGLILLIGMFTRCAWFGENNSQYEIDHTMPALKQGAPLIYPPKAKSLGEEGAIMLDLHINKQGSVDDIRIRKSSGHTLLDSSAYEYGRKLIFTPATWSGEPAAIWYTWRVDFKLNPVNHFTSFTVETYTNKVYELVNKAEGKSHRRRNKITSEILKLHKAYVAYLTKNPQENHNPTIKPFVSNSVYEIWQPIWKAWPLRFVVYQDLMNRFPDSDEADYAKAQMIYLLKMDIQRLQENHDLDPDDKISGKLVDFLDQIKSDSD